MTADATTAGRLRQGWARRPRFVMLLAGHQALATAVDAWHEWGQDPQRCDHLHLIAVAPVWPDASTVQATARGVFGQARAAALAAAWPPPTRNLHRLAFEGGRLQLLLAAGPLAPWLRELDATVDAFVLHGLTQDGPAGPIDIRGVAQGLARLAAAGACLHWSDAPAALSAALPRVGFAPDTTATAPAEGHAYQARFAARRPARGLAFPPPGRIVVVGAGLAGCAAAGALAEQGWPITLVDRHPAPCQEASANPGGLFHGTVNGDDGPHARFNRAAALETQRAVRVATTQHGVPGASDGLLRLVTAPGGWPAMQAQLERHALPAAYVQALDIAAAGARAGVRLAHPAWYFPGGGWVAPAGLARSFLARAGEAVSWLGGRQVHAMRRDAAGWVLLDARGAVVCEADTVVLANAGDAGRLVDTPGWPLRAVRGQISLLERGVVAAALPHLPLAGSGYLLPDVGGRVLFGATAQPDDADPSVRASDHAYNLARLRLLVPGACPQAAAVRADRLQGRVAWRWMTPDRLPLVGPVADLATGRWSADTHLSRMPRLPGLHVYSGLASRGITWAALGAQVLAARLGGLPMPVERSLRDALDPARFALRAQRRSAG